MMKITSGLASGIVLQRDSRNRCRSTVAGEARGGEVYLQVPEISARWKRAAIVRDGKFRFRFSAIPAGGPYTVRLSLRAGGREDDRLEYPGVLVGDVWLCAGQSNMEGWGKISHALNPVSQVRAFFMDDRWDVARDPIHNLKESVDAVHVELLAKTHPPDFSTVGTGPAVSFGQAMFRKTRVPQGLIACAHGGTSMEQWRIGAGGNSLYGAMLRRLWRNGGAVAGMIWYQGESDANPTGARFYTRRMRRLAAALRRDAGANLPIVMAQIGRAPCAAEDGIWDNIREQQRLLPRQVKNLAVVSTIDLGLDDAIHLGGAAQHILGERFAGAMLGLCEPAGRRRRAVALRSIRVIRDRTLAETRILVDFDHVVGALTAAGRATGFEIVGGEGRRWNFDTCLDRGRVILRTGFTLEELKNCSLCHGRGVDPYCNIVDGSGQALAAFGPLPLFGKYTRRK